MHKKKKKTVACILMLTTMTAAQAEVLVILPESGPMARAATSIQQGFMQAYQASQSKIPVKFVNADQKTIPDILLNDVNANTQMIVGPLARQHIEAVIESNPSIKTLALNSVDAQHKNVMQFSLAKVEDAKALSKVIEKDKLKELFIVRKAGTEQEYELFLSALLDQLKIQHEVVAALPVDLKAQQGILLLGDAGWIKQQQSLPQTHVYSTANSVENVADIPVGLKYCDTSAQYSKKWAGLKPLLDNQAMPFQRLMAFGGDAWQIVDYVLVHPNKSTYQFEGRTGTIQMKNNQIQRTPHCFERTAQQLKVIL